VPQAQRGQLAQQELPVLQAQIELQEPLDLPDLREPQAQRGQLALREQMETQFSMEQWILQLSELMEIFT